MACERIEKFFSSYLEGELGTEEKNLVESHLQSCPDCALLLAALQDARQALGAIPELEVSENLLARLYAMPEKKRRFSFSRDFLLKPSLQPVFAAATAFLLMISLYLFNPNKKYIDKTIDQKIHLGYSQAEKIYVKAGSWLDRLDAYKDNLVVSVKNWKIFGGNNGQTIEKEE